MTTKVGSSGREGQKSSTRASAPGYPSLATIKRFGDAARALGIDPAGLVVGPDGVIKILDRRVIPSSPNDEFANWENKL